jgi:hypothetical protein
MLPIPDDKQEEISLARDLSEYNSENLSEYDSEKLGFGPDIYDVVESWHLYAKEVSDNLNIPYSRDEKIDSINLTISINGDDLIGLGTQHTLLMLFSLVPVLTGMPLSLPDTSFDPFIGTYTESVFVKPNSMFQTWHNTRRNFETDTSVIDVPKIRTLIGVRSTRLKASETHEGRIGVLENTLNAWDRHPRLFYIQQVCKLFQDVNLGYNGQRPVYLPKVLGGLGGKIPFDTGENLLTYFKRYKRGRTLPILGDLIRRACIFSKKMEKGEVYFDPLLSRLARLESNFHDWIKGKTLFIPEYRAEIPPEIHNQRLFKASDLRFTENQAASRLINRGLTTQSAIEVAVEHNQNTELLLCQGNYLDMKRGLERLRKELKKSNSNWIGVITKTVLEFNLERDESPLSGEEISYFLSIDRKILRRSLLRDEAFFKEEVLDGFYARNNMACAIELWPYYRQIRVIPDWGDGDPPEWEKKTLEYFLNERKGDLPTFLINDDEEIIRRVSESKVMNLVIITDDRKLVERAQSTFDGMCFFVPYKKVLYLHLFW